MVCSHSKESCIELETDQNTQLNRRNLSLIFDEVDFYEGNNIISLIPPSNSYRPRNRKISVGFHDDQYTIGIIQNPAVRRKEIESNDSKVKQSIKISQIMTLPGDHRNKKLKPLPAYLLENIITAQRAEHKDLSG